jgi:tellurium resistance protein TerD
VTIHDADAAPELRPGRQLFIRIVNEVTGVEIVRYDLAEDASTETAMIFAEL